MKRDDRLCWNSIKVGDALFSPCPECDHVMVVHESISGTTDGACPICRLWALGDDAR